MRGDIKDHSMHEIDMKLDLGQESLDLIVGRVDS